MADFLKGQPIDNIETNVPIANSESCSNLYTAAYNDIPHLNSIGGGRNDQILPVGNGFPNIDMGLVAPADSMPFNVPGRMLPGGGMPMHEVELGNWKDGGTLTSIGSGRNLEDPKDERIERKSWMKRNFGFDL